MKILASTAVLSMILTGCVKPEAEAVARPYGLPIGVPNPYLHLPPIVSENASVSSAQIVTSFMEVCDADFPEVDKIRTQLSLHGYDLEKREDLGTETDELGEWSEMFREYYHNGLLGADVVLTKYYYEAADGSFVDRTVRHIECDMTAEVTNPKQFAEAIEPVIAVDPSDRNNGEYVYSQSWIGSGQIDQATGYKVTYDAPRIVDHYNRDWGMNDNCTDEVRCRTFGPAQLKVEAFQYTDGDVGSGDIYAIE